MAHLRVKSEVEFENWVRFENQKQGKGNSKNKFMEARPQEEWNLRMSYGLRNFVR